MISCTNIICMRLLWLDNPSVPFWLLSVVARLVPIVNRSAVRVLEQKESPLLPTSDIALESKVEVIKINNSTPIEVSILRSDNAKNRVRAWSVEYILEVAKKLTHAIALLREDQYNKISQHIEKYIANISSADPQYALVALWDVKERLDVFSWANISKKLDEATHLYAPPSEWVYAWFRDSQYILAQRGCIKELSTRRYIMPMINIDDTIMATALSHITELNTETQQVLRTIQWNLHTLAESISYSAIYTKYFGKLDDNIVWILYTWDILDPILEPMIAEHFKWKKDTSATEISPELEELLYINLIDRNKAPNPVK